MFLRHAAGSVFLCVLFLRVCMCICALLCVFVDLGICVIEEISAIRTAFRPLWPDSCTSRDGIIGNCALVCFLGDGISFAARLSLF